MKHCLWLWAMMLSTGSLAMTSLSALLQRREGGKGEVDKLIGGKGNDILVLGSDIVDLYDNNDKSSGTNDFTNILDLSIENDRLRLSAQKAIFFKQR